MMKNLIVSIVVLIACTVSLSAQITRERADEIVLDHIKNDISQSCLLYVNVNVPEPGLVISTHKEETVKVKYACRAYFFDEYTNVNGPYFRRYFFVKENDGNLLEIVTSNDYGPSDLTTSWELVDLTGSGIDRVNNIRSFFPNPVDDWLTIPCTGNRTRIEIYDLKGTLLLSETFSDEDACLLNVSFLKAGIYTVSVCNETSTVNHKIIKN